MIIAGVFIPDTDAQAGWDMRLITPKGPIRTEKLRIGDTFYYDERAHDPNDPAWKEVHEKGNVGVLSEHYRKFNNHRLPLFTWLPGKVLFCLDAMCWEDEHRYGGWQVSGRPPFITLNSQIVISDAYRGYLTQGHLTPDMDGRMYDRYGAIYSSGVSPC